MKILKFLFTLLLLASIISSCTPQTLEEDQDNIVQNTQGTGDDDIVDDGSKE